MMSTRAMPRACGTLNSFFDRHGAVRIAPTLRVMRGFVDIHSHMVPSGDDGVRSVDEAVELVLEAGLRGTAVQYATPHAMERHPFTDQRRRRVTAAREQIRARLEGRVDFRVGWEISPERWLLAADPRMLAVEGLDARLAGAPLPDPRAP